MPESILAAVMPGARRPIEHRRFPAPIPRPGGAVLETIASEVCGTDVHLHHGRLAGVPFPIIPGHVNCGRVLETGGPVFDVEGREILPGAVVTFFDVFATCGSCWHCLVAKSATRCPSRKVYGITTSAEDGLLGGWAERIEILPGVRMLPLPEGISPEDFMGGGCGLPTGFHAVERAGISLGDTVVVQGSGPVGLNAAIFAQLSGALAVYVVGAPRARLEAATRLGAAG
ncbi:MAG TPA: alcohol dehydrogenase catalytic domain-containing protein, partial [Thermoanaerobaculia bacterium]